MSHTTRSLFIGCRVAIAVCAICVATIAIINVGAQARHNCQAANDSRKALRQLVIFATRTGQDRLGLRNYALHQFQPRHC